MGLATAILTERNSVVISRGQKNENVRTAAESTPRFPDFQAEYEDSTRGTLSDHCSAVWAGDGTWSPKLMGEGEEPGASHDESGGGLIRIGTRLSIG
jgi:hypothetical protein